MVRTHRPWHGLAPVDAFRQTLTPHDPPGLFYKTRPHRHATVYPSGSPLPDLHKR
jgi:hypothetical protein